MAELRSEEEQLDAIKRWWKSNGTSLIIGVVVAAAGVFAWKAWQNSCISWVLGVAPSSRAAWSI